MIKNKIEIRIAKPALDQINGLLMLADKEGLKELQWAMNHIKKLARDGSLLYVSSELDMALLQQENPRLHEDIRKALDSFDT